MHRTCEPCRTLQGEGAQLTWLDAPPLSPTRKIHVVDGAGNRSEMTEPLPPARPLTVASPLQTVTNDTTGRHGVTGWTTAPAEGGRMALYPVAIATVDGDDLVLDEAGYEWVVTHGWENALGVAFERWYQRRESGEHAYRSRMVKQLEAELDRQDAAEAERRSLYRAFEDELERHGEKVVEAGTDIATAVAQGGLMVATLGLAVSGVVNLTAPSPFRGEKRRDQIRGGVQLGGAVLAGLLAQRLGREGRK